MLSSEMPARRRSTPTPVLSTGAADFTEAWLANRRLSEHTRDAYRRDVGGWLDWCADADLDPLRATFLGVDTDRPQRQAAHASHGCP